ncbi:MAG: hypothetical protein JRL30_20765 [Deltaproteobacteria bacterium]|nr:hypothetical protein [Deltaproteobacteria bacterium]
MSIGMKIRIPMAALLFLMVLLTISCSDNSRPEPSYELPEPADYSALGWTEAFEAANAKFSKEYAFTQWKGIDFSGLYATFAREVAEAEAASDRDAFYRAVRRYLFSVPDGHINITGPERIGLAPPEIAGGFGLGAAELEDGRIIAAAVIEMGPAANAGMRAGAELLTWNDMGVDRAVEGVSVLWNTSPPATDENRRIEQIRYLTRASIGQSVSVTFTNPGESETRTAVLTAIDDGKQGLDLVNFAAVPGREEMERLVEYRVVEGGYGYVRIYVEDDLNGESAYAWNVYAKFEEAIRAFVASNVPGIVVDLRGNQGGSDQTAADLSGFFYNTWRHYENQSLYNARTGEFMYVFGDEKNGVIFPGLTPVSITPQSVYYGGPVIALVNPSCISSGEGIAMGIKKSPNGRVVGFYGTNGSFGITGGTIIMPFSPDLSFGFAYPIGRSLDEDLVIQLDSGQDGTGGVLPTDRVPRTMENVLAYANGDDVELRFALALLENPD